MDALPNPKRVKITSRFSRKILNAIFPTIPNLLADTTSRRDKVLLLSERDEHLHLDPVFWGYAPGWWDKPPLINARVETAATSRMFKPLWQHGRVICFADGWFEWKKKATKNSLILSIALMDNLFL